MRSIASQFPCRHPFPGQGSPMQVCAACPLPPLQSFRSRLWRSCIECRFSKPAARGRLGVNDVCPQPYHPPKQARHIRSVSASSEPHPTSITSSCGSAPAQHSQRWGGTGGICWSAGGRGAVDAGEEAAGDGRCRGMLQKLCSDGWFAGWVCGRGRRCCSSSSCGAGPRGWGWTGAACG